MIKYKVTLAKEEYEQLMEIVSKGTHNAQQFRTAYILLNCDEGAYGDKKTGETISSVLKISARMVERVKKRFVEEGFEACLDRKPPAKVRDKKMDGDVEAHLIALSCSKAPKGFTRWSLRLLADKMVELKYVDNISYETVRQVLKKTN
jgi:transposase